MSKKKRASFVSEETAPKRRGAMEPAGSPMGQEQASQTPDQMMQMMQTLQGMISGMMTGASQQYASAAPFTPKTPEEDTHDVVLPKTLKRGIVQQEAIDIHPLYGKLFLTFENKMLGGLPKGCTITITGPPYIGKTRSAMEMMIRAMENGMKVGYVVAEEGFYDENESGRNDLFSRFMELGCKTTGLTEKKFRANYDDCYVIIPNQYHLGKTWADFIRDYRYAVEELEVDLMLIDSINMLDPSRRNTVENLNALKTYNHARGVTAIVIGQIKDDGNPQGGESLFHTSEVAIHFYSKKMGSNAEAEKWGSVYRGEIDVVTARSKVCKTLPFPVKVSMDPEAGLIRVDSMQPEEHVFPADFWKEKQKKKKKTTKKKASKKKTTSKKKATSKKKKKKS